MAVICALLCPGTQAAGQTISIDTGRPKKVAPILYGFHYEEIGMIGDGGLHAELVRNRSFEEATPPRGIAVQDGLYVGIPNPSAGGNKAVFQADPLTGWEATPLSYSPISIKRTAANPLNGRNTYSMEVSVSRDIKDAGGRAAIFNKGYFGMNIEAGKDYSLSFHILASRGDVALDFTLTDENGLPLSMPAGFDAPRGGWRRFEAKITATGSAAHGMLSITPRAGGTFQLDVVSLMPADTWDGGRSVFRSDIMRNLVDYSPDFIRFPGGCLVHGINHQTMYRWKQTIGDIAGRPGAWSKWAPYYRTDGIGYHEFLELCEYTGAKAMYVTSAGMVCTEFLQRDGDRTFRHEEVDLDYYIGDALDAIEYAIGPVNTVWGAERAKNGHPAPFPLEYVEIGNEDSGPVYYQRYEKIFNAIRAKYPHIKLIANSNIGRTPEDDRKRERIPQFADPSHVEIFDEHYYNTVEWAVRNHRKFDAYGRPGPALFIGELGMDGPYPVKILAEGIVKLSMERNADLRPMMADRPLMRNWDFIGRSSHMQPLLLHDSRTSVKTFNYYLCKLFRDNKIDIYYPAETEMPAGSGSQTLFASAGFDSASGEYVVKVINMSADPAPVTLAGLGGPKPMRASVTTLTAAGDQANTPADPARTVPSVAVREMKAPIKQTVPGYSLTVCRFSTASQGGRP